MSRRLAAVAVLIAMVMVAQTLAMAASRVVKNTKQAVTWSGLVRAGVGTAGVPEGATGCSRFDLRVDLPESVWTRPGGLQVAIRWSAAPIDNCESISVRLSNMGMPQQSARIVGRGARCRAPGD